MTDLSHTIIAKSDQLNSDDLISAPITIKITKVSVSSTEQPVAIHYEGDNNKPYKPCKSMMRVLVANWGSDGAKYVGRSLTLYRDPKVKWAGMEVGGIRISHMSHINAPMVMALTATKGSKKAYTVNPLVVAAEKPQAVVITEEEIATLKLEGNEIADKGMDTLKEWWKSIGGAKQKALGSEFLDELKKLATPTAE